jgi:hypothetical protein
MWSVRRLYNEVYRITSAVQQLNSEGSSRQLRDQCGVQCSFDFYTVQEKIIRVAKLTD